MLTRYAAIPFAVMCLTSHLVWAEETKTLSSVVITATKTEQDSFDLPMSIDKVSKEQIQDGNLRMTLSESLARVPGITAQNRTQMAQDPQISSRGFGARSAFGVRGIRVYVDGIPLSMPDGIGNPGSVDLGMIDSIEVMRGPFSAMYGNSSGGVIQMLTGNSQGPAEVEADVLYGSYKTRRESISVSGGSKDFDYQLSTSDFASDGYRQQSKSDKQQATAKLGVKISDDTQLTTLLNWFQQYAQDPGGLKRVTNDPNTPSAFTVPTGAGKGAIGANARAERSNTQIGFNLLKNIDSGNKFNAIAYAGRRDNSGYLASGASGTAGSATIIGRDYYGVDFNWTNKGRLFAKPYTLVAGVNYGFMQDARTAKDADSGEIKVPETVTRNETQTAANFDQYAQAIWSMDEKWDLHGGLRHTRLELDLKNKLTSVSNSVPFDKTIPVVGMTYKATPTFNLYANAGQGFETPTLIELTYTEPTLNNGGANNTTLKSSTSSNYEVGSKWMVSDATIINTSLFWVETRSEIVIDAQDKYTVYKNYDGKTKRTGLELSVNSDLGAGFGTSLAYTYLDATFATSSGTIAAGNRIPGTYKEQAFAEITWSYPAWGFQTGLNTVYSSDVKVKDTADSDKAPSYTVFNLRASLNQKTGHWSTTEYITLNNFTDVKYIGSVKVNDSKSRFFEPAAPSNWIIGVKAAYKF